MINTDKSVTIKIKLRDCLNRTVNTGKLKADNNEAKEMIRVRRNTANQIKTVIPSIIFKPAILIESPNKTPNVVATPLPPLNLKKIVQLCPQIQPTPAKIQKLSNEILALIPRMFGRIATGKNPFKISNANTVIPQPLPKSLRALVAPTLPEPNLRISVPFIIRPKM